MLATSIYTKHMDKCKWLKDYIAVDSTQQSVGSQHKGAGSQLRGSVIGGSGSQIRGAGSEIRRDPPNLTYDWKTLGNSDNENGTDDHSAIEALSTLCRRHNRSCQRRLQKLILCHCHTSASFSSHRNIKLLVAWFDRCGVWHLLTFPRLFC